MSQSLPPSAKRVQDVLQALGFRYRVIQLPHTTRTAAEAAEAMGCHIGQIAKSLVFRTTQTQRPILVIASGANRVNERTIAELIAEPIEKADADYVRQQTGFVIGGVPPIGHDLALETLIDEDLLRYEEIWAAAGTPHAVFGLVPSDLITMTGGRVISVK